MIDQYYTIESNSPGPVITILGGVHGNEFCGYQAIESLRHTLTLTHGTVHMMVANPKAIQVGQRFVDVDMNRIFLKEVPTSLQTSYEYQRSLVIKELLKQSDILIDLHASVKGSQPFIICEQNGFDIARYVSVHNILTQIDYFHPGSTDGYMSHLGKIGICIECGDKEDLHSTSFAIQSVKQVLHGLGLIDEVVALNQHIQNKFKSDYIYKSQSENFILRHAFTDFDIVNAQEVIGVDGGADVYFDQTYHIVFANDASHKNQECFLLVKKINHQT